MDTIALVREFEVACGANLPEHPTQPPVEKLKLRLSLELEELYEKAQAMGLEATFCDMLHKKSNETAYAFRSGGALPAKDDPSKYDPVALLDACCDQRYVQDGTVLTCGLQDIFYPAFQEVQRSNMSKFMMDFETLGATMKHYRELGIPNLSVVPGDDKKPMCVVREDNNKVLKSVAYSPAELTQFFHDRQATHPDTQ
jgi:predicted HAD superfamily Cof-like phosphohydrolase